MTKFVAVYEGVTVGSARLLAVSAEPRIVSKLFAELGAEHPEEDEDGRGGARIVELVRGEAE